MKFHQVPEDFYKHHENMVSALKVIHTWAVFDMENSHKYPRAFELKHVVDLCNKALKGSV
jgi:hypothetical protein